MNSLLLGAIAMASAVAALFFLRFWRQTRDPLFLFFSLAFATDAMTRLGMGLGNLSNEQEPLIYAARLLTFALIIVGIIHKNWG
jgi:Family of unknown function (DUF5985)